MNAPPFPLNPQVGEWSGNWVWNGARWVSASTTGLRVVVQTFNASGPYMPSPGLVSCQVECIGGGGGGGAVYTTALPSQFVIFSGGAGGSGGYSKIVLPAALVRGGVLVTVGQGGQGGPSGGPSGAPAQDGEAGGATSFGALCVANGGGGGGAMNINIGGPYGGDGATPGIGDVAFPGACGQPGSWQEFSALTTFSASTTRGGWIFGGTTAELVGAIQGATGPAAMPNTGAGGGGALINQMATGSELTGGAGGSGLCIVTEYVVGDRDQPVTEWRPPLDVNLNVTQRPPWPPRPPGPWWPPGWPPGWQPGSPWPPGWGPRPPWIQPFEGQTIEGQEFEAGAEPYSQDPQDPEDP